VEEPLLLLCVELLPISNEEILVESGSLWIIMVDLMVGWVAERRVVAAIVRWNNGLNGGWRRWCG
jgi:hypothetical protein